MSPVFGHGRLRLYLLKLLDESPRHGYDVIRILEDRFLGVYAPSAGTIYPRLARLEEEGLVTHDQEGGRKVYRLTDAGRTELGARLEELAELEREIEHSVRDIAREVKEDVRDSVRGLREELKQATRDVRAESREGTSRAAAGDAWDEDKETWKRRKHAWREEKRAWKDAWRDVREDMRRDFLDASEAVLREDAAARRSTGANGKAAGQGSDPEEAAQREMETLLQLFHDEARDVAGKGYLDEDALRACRSILDNTLTTLRATLRPGD